MSAATPLSGERGLPQPERLPPGEADPRAPSSPVCIHGGGFSKGSGDEFDGSLLAEANNIVVVTINYRLGAFGFLNLPGLSDAEGGNYGLLDQIAALKWTHGHIDQFGGDPTRVTIAGLSAGGHSVCSLLASPMTRGLLSGAIIHSGGCPSHTVAESRAASESFANDAGCGGSDDPIDCLRRKPATEVLDSSAEFRHGVLTGPLPTAGVPELPITPLTAVQTGRFEKVPVLMGRTRDEVPRWALPFADATPEQYEKSLTQLFGDRAANVLKRYPLQAFPSQHTTAYALGAVWTDSSAFYGLGGCRYARLAEKISEFAPKTFLYRFDARSPEPANQTEFDPGATHSADEAYLWPTPTSAYDRDKLQLSSEMVRYWGAFVRRGGPDAPGQAEWPSIGNDRVMVLQPGGSATRTSREMAEEHDCDFWNSFDYSWLDRNPDEFARQVGVGQ